MVHEFMHIVDSNQVLLLHCEEEYLKKSAQIHNTRLKNSHFIQLRYLDILAKQKYQYNNIVFKVITKCKF